MDASSYTSGSRGRGGLNHDAGGLRGRSKNKHWSAHDASSTRSSTPNHSDSERWERGGHRGGGRGRGSSRGTVKIFPNVSLRLNAPPLPHSPPHLNRATVSRQPIQGRGIHDFAFEDVLQGEEEDDELYEDDEQTVEQDAGQDVLPQIHEPELDSPEEREKFYQELVKAREQERKTAIAEGKMDDPLIPKRLEDAISIVGTCMDMCPRFERYRRERENNLFEWETIPGTKRVDHNRAVKMYERAAGDKTLPSDLRPPIRTLDYLFHDLLPRGGFSATFNFIRDRSRAVRNDFTMQHITGPLAIDCHDRCARFHILALHFERERTGFSIPLEEQQLMNTLQSLKEFYEDQRGRYESLTELEMRVYHRLIHIRDQKERHEDIPDYITQHPVFELTTAFRLHVQEKSAPISKSSKLVVTAEGMQIFGQLARVLNEQGSTVMVYLVACLLERLFGKDTIDDIEAIRGDLSISDIIDGVSSHGRIEEVHEEAAEQAEENGEEEDEDFYENEEGGYDEEEEEGSYESAPEPAPQAKAPVSPGSFGKSTLQWPSNAPSSQPPAPTPVAASAFAGLVSTPNVFSTQSVFGSSPFAPSKPAATSVFGAPSVFGSFGVPAPSPAPASTPVWASTSTFAAAKEPVAQFPFSGSTKDSSTAFRPPTPPNFFNIKPTTTFIPAASAPQSPTGQPTAPPSIFGVVSNGTPFSNPFAPSAASTGSLSTTSSPGPLHPLTSSLNPKAPAFTPPQASFPSQTSKASIFSQPPSFPSTTTNGIPKTSIPEAAATVSTPFSFAPPPLPTLAATTEPKVNGTPFFSNISTLTSGATTSTSTPPSFFNKPIPPPSKSVTPPLVRPMIPALTIDTSPSISSTSSSNASPAVATAAAPDTVASPRVPPPMPKKQPISLPTTPTMVLQPPSAHLGYLRSTLERSSSGSFSGPGLDLSWGSPTSSSEEILSPLVMASPIADRLRPFNNFTPLSTPKTAKRIRTGSSPPPSPTIKTRGPLSGVFGLGGMANVSGKGKAPQIGDEEGREMEEKALAFARKSVLVKECLEWWVQRTTDMAAYLEARRHDEEYRIKLRASANGRGASPQRKAALIEHPNGNGMVIDKKRRISSSVNGIGEGREHELSPFKKRARKRASGEYRPPRTDAELAKRFKENHQEHEQRWAQGSFLQAVRKHVTKLSPTACKLPWNIWVTMNPESDGTAIWLERKFDVPASGAWASESVFSIPLSSVSASGPDAVGYPGLIVFECTPLGDICDELEKKYRVLDDCSRLREVFKSLSPRRHFVPSLLVVSWGERNEVSNTSDFFTMVDKLVADSVLQSYQVFAITSATKGLDAKLEAVLSSLTLDTEGKLVKTLSVEAVFKLFEPTFDAFLQEWIENCTINGRFNWGLYGQVIQTCLSLLDIILKFVQSLLELSGPQDLFLTFEYSQINDSESCYEAANEWLSTLNLREDAKLIATDMQSHRNIGQDFPRKIFIEHLFELNQTRFERIYSETPNTERAILITSINASLESFKEAIRPYQLKLNQTYNFSVRRSPKRRAYSVTTSEQGSSEAKRQRLTASVTSVASTNGGDVDTDADGTRTVPTTPRMNGNRPMQTPSPTGSTISAVPTESERPTITVAMLRALTRDLKKRYAVGL